MGKYIVMAIVFLIATIAVVIQIHNKPVQAADMCAVYMNKAIYYADSAKYAYANNDTAASINLLSQLSITYSMLYQNCHTK